MLNSQTAAIPDIYVDIRIPHDAYRPTFVKSPVMTPVGRDRRLLARQADVRAARDRRDRAACGERGGGDQGDGSRIGALDAFTRGVPGLVTRGVPRR
jgi:hypothetical protein